MTHSRLPEMALSNKSVFLRADLNVPLAEGIIESDFRLQAILPTLNLLIKKQAKIVLGTHIDRPQGHDEAFSTKHLIPWFKEHDFEIRFAENLQQAHLMAESLQPGSILLLENLRFDEREHNQDPTYALELHSLAEYYVNDAFGLLHRLDTSITLLPSLYPREKKTIGLLIEREIRELDILINAGKYTLILGGGKAQDKLVYLELLFDSLQACILLPAVAFPFLQAHGVPLGTTAPDEALIKEAQRIMALAADAKVPLIIPTDFLVRRDINTAHTKAPLEIMETVPENYTVLSFGPETIKRCAEIIERTPAIFINGLSGFLEEPGTVEPFKKLLQSVAKSNALSIVGGGESVAAVFLYNLESEITYCSTGGGASLYYLGHRTLPALDYAD